ncbi:MAG TPA: hypothetical protein VGR57_16925, partial [Ktedonobacterales bacterium]|nr:hypothetical protein [Ktedonobacterales bacterium]
MDDEHGSNSSLVAWLAGSAVGAALLLIVLVAVVLLPLAAFGLLSTPAGPGDLLLPGRIWRQSEFVYGLTGDCGPDALAMAEGWASQQPVTPQTVYATYLRMRAHGLTDANGVSTLAELAAESQLDGATYTVLPYDAALPAATWATFLAANLGQRAIIYQTANGQALVDAVSSLGENASNLQGHFLMLVGRHVHTGAGDPLPTGFWAADGDNFAVGDVLQLYPDALVAASRPVGALAVTA